jgi:organic radical activating enzyme
MTYDKAILKFGTEVKLPITSFNGLLLSSDGIFYSLQGEGLFIGQPAIFIRLHMCNLCCDWTKAGGGRCDTFYTWDRETKEYWTSHSFMLFEDVLKEIKKYPCKRIVFTGGEPLIQQKQIATFIKDYLNDHSYIIEIETNGTILPSSALLYSTHTVWLNCSPKLSAAGMPERNRINSSVLEFVNHYSTSVFKFVVTNDEDLLEVDEIVKAQEIFPGKVIIMPEGVDRDAITLRMQDLVEKVKSRGWAMIPRLQIFIWGNKRGV